MDLSLLRAFVAVIENGSFSRAAEHLCTSQSSVSRAISRLEDELGVVLLERTTRKLRATPAGEALFTETANSLDRIAVALDDARRIGRGAHARLRIGICQSVALDAPIFQRGLQAFQAIWPRVELILSSVMGACQSEKLRASALDIGIRMRDPTDCHDLQWQVLKRNILTVSIPTSWNLDCDRLQLADLEDRPWILPDPTLASQSYESTVNFLRSAGFEPKIGGVADDRMTAQIMLACGLGVALSHAPPSDDGAKGFITIPVSSPPPGTTAETAVMWASPATSAQVNCLVECLRKAASGTAA